MLHRCCADGRLCNEDDVNCGNRDLDEDVIVAIIIAI